MRFDGDGDGGWMVWDGDKRVDYNIFDLESAKNVADNYAENQYGAIAVEQENTTKFSQYQLPGGLAYKEVLLTMPENSPFVKEVKRLSTKHYGL